jgi:hypothetical protein
MPIAGASSGTCYIVVPNIHIGMSGGLPLRAMDESQAIYLRDANPTGPSRNSPGHQAHQQTTSTTTSPHSRHRFAASKQKRRESTTTSSLGFCTPRCLFYPNHASARRQRHMQGSSRVKECLGNCEMLHRSIKEKTCRLFPSERIKDTGNTSRPASWLPCCWVTLQPHGYEKTQASN